MDIRDLDYGHWLLFIGAMGWIIFYYVEVKRLRADCNKLRKKVEEWRKRAIYMVSKRVPGETREETCIRMTQDALWEPLAERPVGFAGMDEGLEDES